jgi:hypothetical protein
MSQKFLFDDNVKSRVMNDVGWFEIYKEELDGMWPHAQTEKMPVNMRRLRQDAGGALVLDHFSF